MTKSLPCLSLSFSGICVGTQRVRTHIVEIPPLFLPGTVPTLTSSGLVRIEYVFPEKRGFLKVSIFNGGNGGENQSTTRVMPGTCRRHHESTRFTTCVREDYDALVGEHTALRSLKPRGKSTCVILSYLQT